VYLSDYANLQQKLLGMRLVCPDQPQVSRDDWTWTWHEFDLPQLIRKTITDPADMILTDFHHTIYEVEGDVADLANVKNSELLDKKVVKRSSESTLNLKDLTIEEELAEYLSAILNLNDEKINKIMGVFNDYSKNATMG
jgi:hypothetical protein